MNLGVTEPTFFCRDGNLFYRDWCWFDDDIARARMERMAEHFESPNARCPDLARECRQALADYDAFWSYDEDNQLRWETETAA